MRTPAALLCAILFVRANIAQTLSITPGNSHFLLQASAPLNGALTLQASENLHLWIDIQSNVPEHYSLALTNSDVSARFYRLTPASPELPPIRVILVGDSLAADCCGWGQAMSKFFKPNAAVINYAEPYSSTRIFLQSAEFQNMLLVKPNYVLIQWGYWDGSLDPDRVTTAQQFADNLRTIGQAVSGFGGVPIFVTLHANRAWDSKGQLIPSDHPYNPITRRVAAELNVPLVDLYPTSFTLFNRLGQSGCAFMLFYPTQPEDGMHVSPLGAVYLSQLIAQMLPDVLGPYLTGVLDPPPQP